MFQDWGFLIGEMLLLIVLAALLGLLVGWIIWGRGKAGAEAVERLRGELDASRAGARKSAADLKAAGADLDTCRAETAEKDKRLDDLARDVDKAEALAEAAEVAAMEAAAEAVAVAEAVEADHGAHPVHPEAVADPVPEPNPEPNPDDAKDSDGNGVVAGTDEGVKPATLTAARGGTADDLKQIKGIGPKLEQLCNALGFYHFDQIATWTADEVAWVDANLKGFKGRVSRDNWVAQAKGLATGATTVFASKVKTGGVYE